MRMTVVTGFLLLVFLVCGFGNALTLYRTESQLIQASDMIVYGRIIGTESAWDANRTHIETTARVLVNDTLKIDPSVTILPGTAMNITVQGGTVGNMTERVEDTPILINDTEGVFFLRRAGTGAYAVVRVYEVVNGKIGQTTAPSGNNDVAALKEKVIAVGEGRMIDPTPTTPKAGMWFAPVLVVGILVLFGNCMRKKR